MIKKILAVGAVVLMTACNPAEPVGEENAVPSGEPETSNEEASTEETLGMTMEFQEYPEIAGEYYGTLVLKGYLKMGVVQEMGSEEELDYAYFVFEQNENKAIYDYMESSMGNSFLGENMIGLGCYDETEKKIHSINFGNETEGDKDNVIEGETLEKLLAASEEAPVTLVATKPAPGPGHGAPACTSHFRNFEVL